MTQTADILVIGAGAAGLGVAAHLAGDMRVTVLEAEARPCVHSTGRSAALYIKSYGPPGIRAATAASETFFTETSEGLTDAPLLRRRGLLHIEYDDATGHLAPLMAENSGVEAIGVGEALAMVPILRPEAIAAVAYEDAAFDIDVDLLTGAFGRMMKAGGARVAPKARVAALARAGGVWRAETPAGAFEAPLVVNAAGAWASEIAALAGAAPIRIQPRRRSAAILPAPGGHDTVRWPAFDDLAERWYAIPQGGKLMVSPADADPVEACDIHPDDMVLAEGLDRYAGRVTAPLTRVERTWAGLRSFSPDGEPVVGFDAEAEGFFWLAGQGGYGVQASPGLSAMAAALATGRESATPGAAALMAPSRFR